MPRNQRHVDRSEKEKSIVDAAYSLFLQEGYDSTSMAKIAQRAQIASNTIYWYFKDKDDVLVAVLSRALFDRIQAYQQLQSTALRDRLSWIIAQLQQISRLVSTVHARIDHSQTIATWHEQFHLLTQQLFFSELQQYGFSTEKFETLTHIWTFTIEGILMHNTNAQQTEQIIDVLFQQLRPVTKQIVQP